MREATAHQRPDGMFELRPVFENNEQLYNDMVQFHAYRKRKLKFESANPPIPTDDKDLVEGQKVDRDDYEPWKQARTVEGYRTLDSWEMQYKGNQLHKLGTRDILRKKSNLPSVQPIADNYNNLTVNEIVDVYNSWPLPDVLAKLVEATDHLLNVRNYDLTGWEEVSHCVKRGREILAVLKTHKVVEPIADKGEIKAEQHRLFKEVFVLYGDGDPMRDTLETITDMIIGQGYLLIKNPPQTTKRK